MFIRIRKIQKYSVNLVNLLSMITGKKKYFLFQNKSDLNVRYMLQLPDKSDIKGLNINQTWFLFTKGL